jgi:hypothetical protein
MLVMSKRARALAHFLGVGSGDLVCLNPNAPTKTLFKWGNIYYQVLSYKDMVKGKVKPPHFIPYSYLGIDYRIRELARNNPLLADKL